MAVSTSQERGSRAYPIDIILLHYYLQKSSPKLVLTRLNMADPRTTTWNFCGKQVCQRGKKKRTQLIEIGDGGRQMELGSSIGRMNIAVSEGDLGSVLSDMERDLAELSSDG